MRKLISFFLFMALASTLYGQPETGAEEEPEQNEPTYNWNQWNISPVTGISEGMLKLAIGGMYTQPTGATTISVVTEFEYMMSDIFGLTGELGVPISTSSDDTSDWPGMLGGNLHLFPRSNFDVYLGGKGGFHYLRPKGLIEKLVPTTQLHVGFTLYFWGAWFMQAEGGYAFYAYGDELLYQDHSTPRGSFKTGFFF